MPASATTSMPACAAVSAMIAGVPTSQPPMPGCALEGRAHLELVALREPALDRRSELVLELAPDVEERGRAGAAVQVLVGAADREVDAVRVRGSTGIDAGGVRQVPQDERAGRRAPHR